jgi:hypothetical protein
MVGLEVEVGSEMELEVGTGGGLEMGVFNLICTFSIGIHFEFGVGGGRPLDAE